MRAIVQRITQGNVKVDNQVIASANKGFMVLVGFHSSDLGNDQALDYIIDKLIHLRVFEDDQGKMNLSIKDIDGDFLIVPNFTLYGDCRKGRRPSFSKSADSVEAATLFHQFIEHLRQSYSKVETGIFQADMKVEIVNDGPVTLLLDSDKNF